MTALKQKFLLVIGLGVFWALLLTPFEIAKNKSFWDRLMDGSHCLVFAAVSFLLLWIWGPNRLRAVGIVSAILVIAVELVQPLSGRTFGIEDVVNGLLGVIAVVSGSYLWSMKKESGYRLVHFVLTLGALGYAFFPAWTEWQLVLFRQSQFPILGAFEDEHELSLWEPLQKKRWKNASFSLPLGEVSISKDFVQTGTKNLRIVTRSDFYSGVVFQAEGQDWSTFQALSFQAYNPGTAFTLRLRIDDLEDCRNYNNRFNKQIVLEPGVNQIQIPTAEIVSGPTARKLKITAVQKVFFFVGPEEEEKVFYLDEVKLMP